MTEPTEASNSNEHQSQAAGENTARSLGRILIKEAKPVDANTTSPKARTLIELMESGKDSTLATIIKEDYPEKFTWRDASDFMDMVEQRHDEGKPVNYFDFSGDAKAWGIPVLRSWEDEAIYGEKAVEFYTELLDETLDYFDSSTIHTDLKDGDVIDEESDDIASTSALGWGGSDEDSLREYHLEIAGSYIEDVDTKVEVADEKVILRNALVRLRFGYQDKWTTTRASYLVDLAIDKNGKFARLDEPHYISGWSEGVTVKELSQPDEEEEEVED